MKTTKLNFKPNKYYKKDRKLRILWNSNSVACHSGYGTQSNLIVYGLLKAGFPIAHSAFYGLEGGEITLNGLKIYPKMGDVWGSDCMIHHAKDWNADVSVAFQDSWPLNHQTMTQVKNWIAYTPIDSDPVHPEVVKRLGLAWRVITMADFGYKQLLDKGIPSTTIYHGVDTKVYKKRDKAESRKMFNLMNDKVSPNAFFFGMVAANKDNPPRKSFQEVLDAFAMFIKKHPDSGLFIQTSLNNPNGFPIVEYCKYLGIADNVFFLNEYQSNFKLDSRAMSHLFSCLDGYIATSQSEGFGLPIIEAQSCEVPVITTDWTAMKENIIDGKTGYLVKVASKRWTAGNCYFGIPDTQDIYEKMEKLYKADREQMGKNAREYILSKYDFENGLLPKWISFFEKVEKELYPQIDKK